MTSSKARLIGRKRMGDFQPAILEKHKIFIAQVILLFCSLLLSASFICNSRNNKLRDNFSLQSLFWIILVCGQYHSDEIQFWHNCNKLATYSTRKLGVIAKVSDNPPKISIGFLNRRTTGIGLMGCQRMIFRREKLLLFPLATIQIEIPKAGF